MINVIVQRVRSSDAIKRVTPADAQGMLDTFLATEFDVQAPTDLLTHAYGLTFEYGLSSLHDAMYVALVGLLPCDLWTDDRRLLRALGGRLPHVRWIGEYAFGGPECNAFGGWSGTCGNVQHIARRDVTPEEMEAVCHGRHIIRVAYAGRLMLIGPAGAGQVLAVVLEPVGEDTHRPITGRPASRRERLVYAGEIGEDSHDN